MTSATAAATATATAMDGPAPALPAGVGKLCMLLRAARTCTLGMYRKNLAFLIAISMPLLAINSCRTPAPAKAGSGASEGLPQTAVYGMVMDHMASLKGDIPKVLVVGIDGLRRDCLWKAGLADLIARRMPGARLLDAYAGGDPPDRLQPTLTAPGFASVLTGEWADVHKVRGNLAVAKDTGVLSFAGAVQALHPATRAAVLAAWEVVVNGCTNGDGQIYRYYPGKSYYSGDYATKDPSVVAESELCIAAGYDVVFAVLDLVDHEGHLSGFSPDNPAYIAAALRAFGMVEALLDAIAARAGRSDEDWLVILTADHGGKGWLHGGQSPEERAVFILEWEAGSGQAK